MEKKYNNTRAKFIVTSVKKNRSGGVVNMEAVHAENVNTEDNIFSHWIPSGKFTMSLSSQDRCDQFIPGEKYYLDFSLAEN